MIAILELADLSYALPAPRRLSEPSLPASAVQLLISTRSNTDLLFAAKYPVEKEPEGQSNLLVDHMKRIRSLPGFEAATIVFAPESNLAFEGIHQANKLKKLHMPNICIMEEDDGRPGVRTDNNLKKAMATALRAKIIKGKVKIHRSFVVAHPEITMEKVLTQLKDELDGFSVVLRPNKVNPHEDPKEFYTGKLGQGKDDLAIALQLNLIMKRRFTQAEKYAKWK